MDFYIKGDEKLGGVSMPSMIIQPIVENAIIHGIDETGGKIIISIKERKDKVIIRIFDNGIGMEKEKISRIVTNNTMNHTGHTTGIGLKNISARLMICEGTAMSIRSRIGKGTLITISLPKEMKEEISYV
jgi:sensor histidine kinase YesM